MIPLQLYRVFSPFYNVALVATIQVHSSRPTSPKHFKSFLVPRHLIHWSFYDVKTRRNKYVSKALRQNTCAKYWHLLVQDRWLTWSNKETVIRYFVILVTSTFSPVLFRGALSFQYTRFVVEIDQELHVGKMWCQPNKVILPVLPEFATISRVLISWSSHVMVFNGEVYWSLQLF